MNVIKTVRSNWKKTVVLIGVGALGVKFVQKKYRERLILKAYCLEAKKYGDALLKNGEQPRKVTVFLNPAAKRGKGRNLYEKNVAPLLHLAGLEVTLVKTEYEGQAKKYMDVVDPTDAVITVGGDGTVSEVVTGLLRRKDEEQFASRVPLGVVPVGHTNSLAQSLCPPTDSSVAFIAEMTLSAIKGNARPVNVVQIVGDCDKSVYAVSGLAWGAYTDAEMRKKSNWYFGPLKHRLAYVVSALRYWPPAYKAEMTYTLACEGCSRCYAPPPKPQWRWWHVFLPPRVEVTKDYSNVVNEECGQIHSRTVSVAEMSARLLATGTNSQALELDVLDSSVSKLDFIKDGWNRLTGDPPITERTRLNVRELTLSPVEQKNADAWFLIDSERFELMDIKCRLLPDKLRFFATDTFSVPLVDIGVWHKQ